MKVSVQFSFIETVIPPGRRKAVDVVQNSGRLTATIKTISSEDAPVAIVAHMAVAGTETQILVPYRWYQGKLWTPTALRSHQPYESPYRKGFFGFEVPPAELDLTDNSREARNRYLGADWETGSQEATARAIRGALRGLLIIDGLVHREASEPRYVVMTFGLGRNHGGTALMTDDHFNSNLNRSSYFSLLDLEAAKARATEIATNRGDTKCLPIAVNGPVYQVLLPEAIRIRTHRVRAARSPAAAAA